MTTTLPSAPKPAAAFLARTTAAAASLLDEWVGEARAAEAKGRIATAFTASAMSARDPSDFYAATGASVAQCVAISALTGIMPGTGPAALAYLVPRRPRKGEPPQLQYQLSHRGLAALARRAGAVMLPIPVGHRDTLEVLDGEVARFEPDVDDPPTTWDELRGVVLVVKERDGAVIFRGFVPRKIIETRRAMSDSYRFAEDNPWAQRTSTWHQWPVEMAMKTAMHYAVSRGWAVVDDTEAVRALSVDAAADVIDLRPADYAATTSAHGAAAELGIARPALTEDPDLDVPAVAGEPVEVEGANGDEGAADEGEADIDARRREDAKRRIDAAAEVLGEDQTAILLGQVGIAWQGQASSIRSPTDKIERAARDLEDEIDAMARSDADGSERLF